MFGAALHDLEQRVHRGNFLELLGQEPLQEIIGDEVVLRARQFDQRVDLVGHFDFLVEGKLDRFLGVLESRLRRGDCGDHHPPASVDHVFDEAHGVIVFFGRLAVKMFGQLRERIAREIGRDRDVLHASAELVADLFVDRRRLLSCLSAWISSG